MSPRVLLLDDEPEIVYVVGEYLATLGWQTIQCASLSEASAAVAQSRAFDAAVIDWVVGGSSARLLIEQLQKRHPKCAVLLATGLGADMLDEREVGLPVIRKPYTMRALASRLDGIVNLHRS